MIFKGTVTSDFLKNLRAEDDKKSNLIDFAASDFLSFRNSLINYIKTAYPLDYNYFAESDLGMMLIECVAAMGHILSFKADYLVNENFLRTARSRNSVKKLLELIGVRMKGPISAAADAKLTLDSNPVWGASGDFIEIEPADRVITVTSPEDGAPLNFTLYKVTPAGLVDTPNSGGTIRLYNSEKDSNTVFTNLVMQEGSLVLETGTFADTEAIKSVRLSQSPVAEGSVQVIVNGDASTSGVYNYVENVFFTSGGGAKVFQLISDDDYGATVVFGDNNLGQSPKVGDTYSIYYRVGGGTRGNIVNELVNAPVTVTFNGGSTFTLGATIENVSQGTGGSDAETLDHAKRYAPLTFRRQDRIVTLDDFKTFANTFITNYGSTGKATAVTRRAYSSANIIDLYVLEKSSNTQLRKATPEYKRQLLEAIQEKKMLTDEVVVVDGLIRTIDPIITVRCDTKYAPHEETIKIKVTNQVIEYFNVDNNDFGKEYSSQRLNKQIFEIPEVRYSTIDNLPSVIKVEFNEIVQLNNLTVNIVFE